MGLQIGLNLSMSYPQKRNFLKLHFGGPRTNSKKSFCCRSRRTVHLIHCWTIFLAARQWITAGPMVPYSHRTISQSQNSTSSLPPPPGELAPMALCDIHVAGCGEHLPAWGLCDDRIPGTDQAVRGGPMGSSCILDSPPGRWMPATVRMPAVVRMPACHSRRFKGERPIGAATG